MMTNPTFQAVSLPDTVVTVASRDAIDVIFGLAAGSIAATFVALLLVITITLVKLRAASLALARAQRRLLEDPGIQSLRATAANVESISDSLRGEVTRLSESVAQLSERVTQASDRVEERIEEFNALLEVMQGEAEQAFVDGASTARGVRAGLGALGRRRDRRSTRGDGPRGTLPDPGVRAERSPTPVRPLDAHPGDAYPGQFDDDEPEGEEPHVQDPVHRIDPSER